MARAKKPVDPDKPAKLPKLWRDVLAWKAQHGSIEPAKLSPICAKCKLDECGSRRPYMPYSGAENPIITVVFDSLSKKEDETGEIGIEGSANGVTKRYISKFAKELGVDLNRIRWITTTRCANRSPAKVNYATKGNWCRIHAVQDIIDHPPQLIIPVGTTALGLFNHKSSAQDWSGKLLTWRGWPDEWLTTPSFMLTGHPLFGAPPSAEMRIPLVPIQSARLVFFAQNPVDIARWQKHIKFAMSLAVTGARAANYNRPWFELSEDPDRIIEVLNSIPDKTEVTYDTETTGLLPFVATAKIVFAMLRWDTPEGPRALAFPWDFAESLMLPFLDRVRPVLLATMYRCRLIGHNLAFDILYTYATLEADLEKLTAAMHADTRHLVYVWRQSNESVGLEKLAYDWCPDMAGYEEDFVLLKDLFPDDLDPAAGKGGHYARCPRDKWPSHLSPYVFGDVEVACVAKKRLEAKIAETKRFDIPLADPNRLGSFARYTPVGRDVVAKRIMLPASRVLTRCMGRGMHISEGELDSQEDMFPKLIKEARGKLRDVDPRVSQWCEQQAATVEDWKLDLEDKEQLKTILFDVLGMPIKRITEAGQKIYGEDPSKLPADKVLQFAAVDKFTLNGLTAEYPRLAPLLEYRKLHKAYTTYVRSMRNNMAEGVDKKERNKPQHLMPDWCVHPTFNQTGTRSGRLSSASPNAQQIPSGSIVKRLYDSRFGARGCVYQSDLSQIELRLLAAACGDPLMVDAYRKSIDLHSLTTSKIFKVPYEHFEKTYMGWLQKNGREDEAKALDKKRKVGKTVNFLTGYGGGAYGLQSTLAEAGVYLPIEECEDIIEAFFDVYPAMRKHIGLYKGFIQQHGCAVSLTGRVRIFDEVHSEDRGIQSKALRSGVNHLIQSSASDMMALSMVAIEQLMREANLESILISTVHDSIVVDAVRAELPIVHEICLSVLNSMHEVVPLLLGPTFDPSWMHVVPLTADSEVGINYADAFKLADAPDWDAVSNQLDRVAA